ncbi:MAG: ABC transporter ATP-binding protein [Lachnospiraceae bacterium]|nr:ABC transporter ATP-binding protein [Lachnospiraceae bacterium]
MSESSQVEKLTFSQKRKLLARALRDIGRLSPGFITAQILISVMEAVVDFVPIITSGMVIDGFASGKSFDYILTVILIGVAVSFVLHIPGYSIKPKFTYASVYRLTSGIDVMLNEKILNMDYVKIENPEIHRRYDRIKTFALNYDRYESFGVYCEIVNKIGAAVKGITYVAAALVVTWELYSAGVKAGGMAIVNYLLLAAVVAILVMQNTMRSKSIIKEENIELSDDTVKPDRVRNYLLDNYFGEYQAVKDIHIYGNKKFVLRRSDELFDKWHTSKLRKDKVIRQQQLLDETCDVVRSVLIYGFVTGKAVAGAVSAGALVQNVQSFYRIQQGFNMAIESITKIDNCMFPLKLIYDFLDIPDEKYAGSLPTEKRDDNEYEFAFHNVSFRYPASEEYVLKNINLKWKIGEKMALVGRNGSGKSTLIKLLCRLYDPTEGMITLNGIDIRKYDIKEYMDLFSVVFQDSKLFSFPLAENVAASMQYDSEKVADCVNRSGLGERLLAMPDGIRTCLYKDFDEKGVEISGGEAQKLTLARAIYKGSPFVILDEPTAALDPVAENEIYVKFNEMVGTRTAIYISHRLSSCCFCDDIMVLDKGQLIERGTHEELVKRDGIYSHMWQAQSAYYRENLA